MKIKLPFPVKRYRVASSRKNPDTGEVLCYWIVELESDGSLYCNCPAGSHSRECRHKTNVREFIQEYEPERKLKPIKTKKRARDNKS